MEIMKCNCTLRGRAVGDGCSICNTEYFISVLPTPEELCKELENGVFSPDQAYCISSDVYQPLLGLIETLNNKINQLDRR